jgi:hypothetical protein
MPTSVLGGHPIYNHIILFYLWVKFHVGRPVDLFLHVCNFELKKKCSMQSCRICFKAIVYRTHHNGPINSTLLHLPDEK